MIIYDFTDQIVLDNLIRGLADEEIKVKVLAMEETHCTMDKVVKFVEAEDLGCQLPSIPARRAAEEVGGECSSKQVKERK